MIKGLRCFVIAACISIMIISRWSDSDWTPFSLDAIPSCCLVINIVWKTWLLPLWSQQGMIILVLSYYVLEIPNDASTILSQNLIGCSTLSQEYCKLIGWHCKVMGRQLWTLACCICNFGIPSTTIINHNKYCQSISLGMQLKVVYF